MLVLAVLGALAVPAAADALPQLVLTNAGGGKVTWTPLENETSYAVAVSEQPECKSEEGHEKCRQTQYFFPERTAEGIQEFTVAARSLTLFRPLPAEVYVGVQARGPHGEELSEWTKPEIKVPVAEYSVAPEIVLETEPGSSTVSWVSLAARGYTPPEAGYEVAVSNKPRCSEADCRETQYLFLPRTEALIQHYTVEARVLKDVKPISDEVYVGVQARNAAGEAVGAWSNEEQVKIAGYDPEVPKIVLHEAPGGTVTWRSLAEEGFSPAESSYEVAVSNKPRCSEEHCRETQYFTGKYNPTEGQKFTVETDALSELAITGGVVYVGVQARGPLDEPIGEYSQEIPVTLSDFKVTNPKITLAEEGKGRVVWESLAAQGLTPPEATYQIAISATPRCNEESCRKTQYVRQYPRSESHEQQYLVEAQNLTEVAASHDTVYVSVLARNAEGEALGGYSPEIAVKVAGNKGAVVGTSADDETAEWSSVGLEEAGYRVEVANGPPCGTSECRTVDSFFQARAGTDPQRFKPNPAALTFTPVNEEVRVRVSTLIEPGEAGVPSVNEVVLHVPAGPPVNTALPVLSGLAVAGYPLSTSQGTWTGSPRYAYQWQSCNASGAECKDIAGAGGAQLAVTAAEVGRRLRAVVTATNNGGSTAADSHLSAVVGSKVKAILARSIVRFGRGWAVEVLEVLGVPHGGTVELVCHGAGCPFSLRKITPKATRACAPHKRCRTVPASPNVNLTHLFHGHRLGVGTSITVRVVVPDWVGEVFRVKLGPKSLKRSKPTCLAPGSTKPGVGC